MTDELKIHCAACGGNQFSYADDMQDESTVTCTGCGDTTTLGALKASAMEQAKQLVHDSLRDILGKTLK